MIITAVIKTITWLVMAGISLLAGFFVERVTWRALSKLMGGVSAI